MAGFLEKSGDLDSSMHFVPASITSESRDGAALLFREVTEADRERALDAFDRLSADDVAMRFWRDLVVLDESLLERLTSPDQINHLAWCVLNPRCLDDPGHAAGSVWRLSGEPTVGEVSLTVLPESQGGGIGVSLFALLWVLSGLLGMETLRANVIHTNQRALEWFTSLGGIGHSHGAFYEINFSLHENRLSSTDQPRQMELAQWIGFFQSEFAGDA